MVYTLLSIFLDCTFVRHPTRYLQGNDITYVAGQTEETCRKLCEQDDVHNCQLVCFSHKFEFAERMLQKQLV